MKIGIIIDNTTIKKNAIKKLIEDSEEYNLDIIIINMDEITINNYEKNLKLGNGSIIFPEEIDVLIPRVDTYTTIVKTLITFIKFIRKDLIVINENLELTSNRLLINTMLQNNKIECLNTYNLNMNNYKDFAEFPYVVKTENGYGNEGIFKVNTQKELLNLTKNFENKKRLIIQNHLKNYNKRDYRFLATKDKIFKTIYDGVVVDNIKDIKLENMIFEIVRILNLDFISIDMIFNNGDYIFIEINKSFLIEDLKEIL